MKKIFDINFEDSINSGQVFLWQKRNSIWYGINGSDVVAVNSLTKEINSFSNNSPDIFRDKDNLGRIFKSISKDDLVKKAVSKFPGLRLLRQDPFQCYISFITSSNSSIQKIRLVLHNLCKKFGEKVKFEGIEFYLFPEPKILAKADKNDLVNCGLGYRTKFVKDAANCVFSGLVNFDNLKKSNYSLVRDSLVRINGIGNKIADCIMLFSLEKLDAFPLDRWMIRVLQKHYAKKFSFNGTITEKKYQSLHQEIVNHFGPFAGYSQQFLFKMERDLHKKKWL